jgi:hypothetical protein
MLQNPLLASSVALCSLGYTQFLMLPTASFSTFSGQNRPNDRHPAAAGTIDVSYLNVCTTFYYLCSILDSYSRFLVHWVDHLHTIVLSL